MKIHKSGDDSPADILLETETEALREAHEERDGTDPACGATLSSLKFSRPQGEYSKNSADLRSCLPAALEVHFRRCQRAATTHPTPVPCSKISL